MAQFMERAIYGRVQLKVRKCSGTERESVCFHCDSIRSPSNHCLQSIEFQNLFVQSIGFQSHISNCANCFRISLRTCQNFLTQKLWTTTSDLNNYPLDDVG